MRVKRSPEDGFFRIELAPAEAKVFLEELSNVRGGARLPKIKQVCKELEMALVDAGAN